MTTEEVRPIRWKTPDTIISPETGVTIRSFQTMLSKSQTPLRNERKLGAKVRTALARQMGTVIKAEYGQHLSRKLSLETVDQLDQYIHEEREILARERLPQDQADVEAFSHIVRECAGNSFLALRQAAINEIETIVTESLDIEDERTEEVIITQPPGVLGRLFGGAPQITRMKR